MENGTGAKQWATSWEETPQLPGLPSEKYWKLFIRNFWFLKYPQIVKSLRIHMFLSQPGFFSRFIVELIVFLAGAHFGWGFSCLEGNSPQELHSCKVFSFSWYNLSISSNLDFPLIQVSTSTGWSWSWVGERGEVGGGRHALLLWDQGYHFQSHVWKSNTTILHFGFSGKISH